LTFGETTVTYKNMKSFVLGDVEITNINPDRKSFSVIVHVKAAPIQMHTQQVQEHVNHRVMYAVRYLVEEGFLPNDAMFGNWKCSIAGVCHPLSQ